MMKNDDPKQLLKSAMAALQVGDKVEGRRILFQVVDLDPNNETAWLLLSFLMETRYERIDCLTKVLAINPNNIEARATLEELGSGPGSEKAHRHLPTPSSPAEEQPLDIRREFLGQLSPRPAQRPATAAPRPAAAAAAPAPARRRPSLLHRKRKIAGFSLFQAAILAFLMLLAGGSLLAAGIFVLPGLLSAPVTPVAQEQRATATPRSGLAVTPTRSLRATSTARSSPAPSATLQRTQVVTAAPALPTLTPTLQPGATRVIELTKQIGPIVDPDSHTYTLQIRISSVRFTIGATREPKTGDYRYIVIDVEITNLGPDVAPGVGNFGFHLKDAQGALRNPLYLATMSGCLLGTADLEVEAVHSGCLVFEASHLGSLELVYEPLWKNPLLTISFTLR